MASRYVVQTGSVALTAATAKTLINLVAGAAESIRALTEIALSLDAGGLVLLELCESTQATAGTSSSGTIKQVGGFVGGNTTSPAQVAAQINYTAEPTVLVALKSWWFNGPGPFVLQAPLGREVQSLVSGASAYKALALRATAVAGVNARAYVEWE